MALHVAVCLGPGPGMIILCTSDSTSLQGSQPTCISYLCFGEEETRDQRAHAACPRSCLGSQRAALHPQPGSLSLCENCCLSQHSLLHFLCLVETFLTIKCTGSIQSPCQCHSSLVGDLDEWLPCHLSSSLKDSSCCSYLLLGDKSKAETLGLRLGFSRVLDDFRLLNQLLAIPSTRHCANGVLGTKGSVSCSLFPERLSSSVYCGLQGQREVISPIITWKDSVDMNPVLMQLFQSDTCFD